MAEKNVERYLGRDSAYYEDYRKLTIENIIENYDMITHNRKNKEFIYEIKYFGKSLELTVKDIDKKSKQEEIKKDSSNEYKKKTIQYIMDNYSVRIHDNLMTEDRYEIEIEDKLIIVLIKMEGGKSTVKFRVKQLNYKGLTQKEIARELGISQGYVSRLLKK